jgi:hypothetical protein
MERMKIGLKLVVFLSCLQLANARAQMYVDQATALNINIQTPTFNQFGTGVSFFDFDEDGWDDLTIVVENSNPIFYKNIQGTFQFIPSFINSIGRMRHLLWVDYDDDGDLDLFATYFDEGVRLYANNGQFVFTDVTAAAGITLNNMYACGASFADFDNDGHLDLYVSIYESSIFFIGVPHGNMLYRNLGNGTFEDVSVSSGTNNPFFMSFQSTWFDYNLDGWMDMYVVNDRYNGYSALFKNNGDGTFTDIADSVGVENYGGNPMSSSVSDFDNDGDFDLFATYRLYRKETNGLFSQVEQAYNIDYYNIFGWGGLFVDVDNDRYQDLYSAISQGVQSNSPSPSFLFRNVQGTDFELINDSISGNLYGLAYCPVKGDLNNDGFYDIAVNNEAPNNLSLWVNSGNQNNYVKINLEGTISNRLAIGSIIEVFTDSITQMQMVHCGENYLGQNSQHFIFGLGNATTIDSIRVKYPSGIVDVFEDLDINMEYDLVEGQPLVIIIPYSFASGDTLEFCLGTTVTIEAPGFTDYTWNNGQTTPTIVVTQPGIYSFTANNSNGAIIQSENLVVNLLPIPFIIEEVVSSSCESLSDGSISLDLLSNDQQIDSVIWQHGDNGLSISNMQSGWYYYTCYTSIGCQISDSAEIFPTYSFEVIYSTTPQTLQNMGSISFTVFGGAMPFQYSLNGLTISPVVQNNLSAGEYVLAITDGNGCVDSTWITIEDQTDLGVGHLEQGAAASCTYANDLLTIFHAKEVENPQIRTVIGQTILDGNQAFIHQDSNWIMPIHLSSGVYILTFTESDILVSRRFTVY